MLLDAVEIETGPRVDASLIWLHGLGASGHDFEMAVPELRLPADAGVRFLFPHAPEMAVTINGGYVMPAWYDILELSLDRRIDEAQLRQSAAAVSALVEREMARGIASERIVLAGFSQGGAVAYEAALTFPQPLAGLVAMSSYFATADSIQPRSANAQIPLLIMHGTQDPVVPESLGRSADLRLQQMGYQTDYRSYPMEHSLCLEQVRDFGAWLTRCWDLESQP